MSIVANGVGGSNCHTNGVLFVDNGYNLDSGSSCGFSTTQHSLNNTDPQLGALGSNGGPTQTMALVQTSPAVNAIPTSFSGCTGSTDQRGTTRPQGTGCDIGAYELIPINDTVPPTVPTGLTAPTVTASAVSLQWNASTDDTSVIGYTVYRNGTSVGSTSGATATTYTDATVAPSTTYAYTVDAIDAAGLHSAQSTPPLSVTTSAPPLGVRFVQGGVVGTGNGATTATISLTAAPIHAGDLLVGWFGQYSSTGLVQVSDNINGAWTRSASETWSGGAGDLALYYVQNAASSAGGVTVTIAASTGTYLEGAVGDYSGVALSGALDKVVVAKAVGTAVDSGATAAVGAGELVVGGIITGASPTSATPGVTQGQTFTMRAQTATGSVDIEDVLASTAGAQNGRATLATSADWYAVAAVFHQYQPPSINASPGPVSPGGTITATWSGLGSPGAGDWIGIYIPGAADSAYLGWRSTTGMASGSVAFTIPASLSPGNYELRLFSNYMRQATSGLISVQVATLSASPGPVSPGGTLTATWSGLGSPGAGDWIGIYIPGAADSAYLGWRSTTGMASGSVAFTIPASLSPGNYEPASVLQLHASSHQQPDHRPGGKPQRQPEHGQPRRHGHRELERHQQSDGGRLDRALQPGCGRQRLLRLAEHDWDG